MKFFTTIFILSVLSHTSAFAAGTELGTKKQKSQIGSYELAAITCFKSGERTSGMNKICYYNCLGSEAAITIKSHQLCPLSINN